MELFEFYLNWHIVLSPFLFTTGLLTLAWLIVQFKAYERRTRVRFFIGAVIYSLGLIFLAVSVGFSYNKYLLIAGFVAGGTGGASLYFTPVLALASLIIEPIRLVRERRRYAEETAAYERAKIATGKAA